MQTQRLGDKGERVKCLERALRLTPGGTFDDLLNREVKAFQAAHGLDADGIVGPKTWAAAGMPAILPGAAMKHVAQRERAIDYVIVHHSDTTTRAGMVRALNAGSKEKSTHYSVDKDGSIHCHADPLEFVTWHCPGANLAGIGVDVIHRKGEAFTDAQVAATGTLLRWLCLVHGLPQVALEGRFPVGIGQLKRQAWGVAGHGQLRATRCPDGFPIAAALNGG
jgi:hypothetical protein